ncbi:MAG: c-type cytochrome [Pseudomonadota bacterium]|nr:c-type cytochrome [Pseudomonadota bacterium]
MMLYNALWAMNKLSIYIKITLLIGLSFSVNASNLEKGKELSAACIACHGQEGVSPSSIWPNLAGQHASYLSKQLYEFKKGPNGNRNNSVMYGISMNLSDQDISDLSEYYASLDSYVGTTADEYLTIGQNIYRGGNMEYKIQACIACHGPTGKGNGPAKIPSLSGQHADYLYTQLKNFQSSVRSNDPNKMMRNIVHRMTDEELKAVSEYIQGLY